MHSYRWFSLAFTVCWRFFYQSVTETLCLDNHRFGARGSLSIINLEWIMCTHGKLKNSFIPVLMFFRKEHNYFFFASFTANRHRQAANAKLCFPKHYGFLVKRYRLCTLGWVDFWLFYNFNKSTPEICYIHFKSTENSKKKNFLTQWPLHHWSQLFGSFTI
jgi:hypothetical protein